MAKVSCLESPSFQRNCHKITYPRHFLMICVIFRKYLLI